MRIRANQNLLLRKGLGARKEAVCKRPITSTTKDDEQLGRRRRDAGGLSAALASLSFGQGSGLRPLDTPRS